MPRPKGYDEDEVLTRAMRVFWEAGYGASTRQLADAMGINQYSVYASFESKQGLFVRALNRYIDHVVEGSALLPLLSDQAAIPELRQFFESFVHTKNVDAPNGCLICNTMIENAEHTRPVENAIERYRVLVIQALSHALVNGFPNMPMMVVRARSDFLFNALLGLFVQKKMGAEGRSVQILVDEIMDYVERNFE
jgi:TetR/AcrR family transcriptional repressor of nem operon